MSYIETGQRPWKYQSVGKDCHRVRPKRGDAYIVEMWSGDYLAGTFHDGLLCASDAYLFDGATKAPDIVAWMRAFKMHDLPCQFMAQPGFAELVMTRAEADRMMLDIIFAIIEKNRKHTLRGLVAYHSRRALARMYYAGVRIGSITPPTKHPGTYLTLRLAVAS